MTEVQSSKAKRAVKNTGLLYFRMLITMIVGLYTSRVILQSLGILDYGLYNVIGGIIGFLGFVNTSMSIATIRFITYEQGNDSTIEQFHQVVCTSRIIHWCMTGIIILVGETIGLWYMCNELVVPSERMFAALVVYQTTIITSAVSVLTVPYNALITSHEKMSAFAYMAIYEVFFSLFVAYIIQVIPFDRLIAYGLLMLVLQVSTNIIYISYCKRKFPEVSGALVFDKIQFKRMVSFAVWITNGTLAVVAYTQALNLLLNSFFGPVVNAARGIAVQVQTKIFQFCSNFQTAIKPQITKSYAEGDYDYLHKLVINTSNYSFYLIFFLSLPVMVCTPTILQLWLGVVPDHTVEFVRWTLVVGMLESLKMPTNTSIHATGNIKRFQTFEATYLLLIVPVCYVLLKLGAEPVSVFIVQAIFFLTVQFLRGWLVCPAIGMKVSTYYKDCLFKIFKVICLPIVISYALIDRIYCVNDVITLLLKCTLCSLLSVISIYFIGLDADMRGKFVVFVKNRNHGRDL